MAVLVAGFCTGFMGTATAQAQDRVEGVVVDAESGEALPGVNVRVYQMDAGTATDAEGQFELTLPPEATDVTFSHVGYLPQKVSVADAGDELHVALVLQQVHMDQVVVSASRHEERRTETPTAVSVLTSREMDAQRPDHLHEALSTLPGVHMADLSNEQHSMSIRQPLTYKAVYAYLEDGVPIRPMGIFNHNALIEVNMAGAERIEVVRGPSSALYGSNAIGGAVNVITPRGRQATRASVGLRGHQHGFLRGDAEVSGQIGEVSAWAGGYVAHQRDGWNEHSDYDKVSLTARADYMLGARTGLKTTLSTNHLLTDMNGSLDGERFYGQGFTSQQTFTYRQVDATRVTSQLWHGWNDDQLTEVTVFARSTAVGQLPHYRIARDFDDPARASGEENVDRFWSLGLQVQHEVALQPLDSRLALGLYLDHSPNRHEARYLSIERDPESGRYVNYTRSDSLLTDYRVTLGNAASYAQLSMRPAERLRLVGSLRYDVVSYDYENFLPPSAFSGAPDERSTFAALSPRLGLTYDLGGSRSIYANYSRGFMPPEINELYRGVSVPSLRPASFDSYEVGGYFSLLQHHVQGELSVYWMDGTDEIISVRREDDTTVNRNAGATRHRGIEYGLTLLPTPDLTLQLTGTVAEHRFLSYEERGDDLSGKLMDNAPTWMANAAVMYELPVLPGARVRLDAERISSYYMDAHNTMRYEGHTLLHGHVGYNMGPFETWLSVRNATGVLYATTASKTPWGEQYRPGSPRTATLGVRYRFK